MREALNTSLAKLGVEYVDLYLMHWPMAYDESGAHPRAEPSRRTVTDHEGHDVGRTLQPDKSPTFVETWKEMEKLHFEGIRTSPRAETPGTHLHL